MSISIMCPSGSPTGIDPSMIYGRGVGGAELALMSIAEEFCNQGLQVTVYNNPPRVGDYNGVLYENVSNFVEDADGILILFRVPWMKLEQTRAKKKIFWSCDQFTEGNYRDDIFPHVDEIVCISPRHVDYFNQRYNADGKYSNKIRYFDLGVRVQDYEHLITGPSAERVRNQMLYCSAPDRGLERVKQIWPRIKGEVPNAELYITFDYRLWGASTPSIDTSWNFPGVHYLGGIQRDSLTTLQLLCDIQLYPCTYDELFCIAVAECQVAGAIPITSSSGALVTTNEFGYQFGGEGKHHYLTPEWLDEYAEFVINVLKDDTYHEAVIDRIRPDVMRLARERFNWSNIAREWIRMFEE